MIYLDILVVLAQLLAEHRRPNPAFWREELVSSRLLEYEIWVRLIGRGLAPSHGEAARALIGNVGFFELTPEFLSRAIEPFPTPVRTFEAIHLASLEFLRGHGQAIELASYDRRMIAAAQALKIPLAKL